MTLTNGTKTTEGVSTSDFHVIIIGAGSAGLLIAQHLKKLNIKYIVFEREEYLNQRSRDWNFGIYWAQGPLSECLLPHIMENITAAQVDPLYKPAEDDGLPMLNAKTGELIMTTPTPGVMRLARSRFRKVIAEGLNIQFGKRLDSVTQNSDETVTARFEDGSQATASLLIGAEGSHSRVRNYLLGPEKAALQHLPLMGGHALGTLPAETAVKFREINEIYMVAMHPEGLVAYASIHEIPDRARPETWLWMFIMTWCQALDDNSNTDKASVRKMWDSWSNKFAEPLRTGFLAVADRLIPQGTVVRGDRLGQWPTVAWDNRGGHVTLMGDAAHPMTFHRGQGLNNAVHDAANLGRAIGEHCHGGKPLVDVIGAYEKEMVERGHHAVVSSGENSVMVHDWSKLQDSPVFKMGMAQDRQSNGE